MLLLSLKLVIGENMYFKKNPVEYVILVKKLLFFNFSDDVK